MTPEERAQVVVTARFLRAAASLQWLAVGLVIVVAARGRMNIPAVASIAFGLIAIFYGFRVSFDAKLFDDVAQKRLTTAELDAALGALRKSKGNRDWLERCRGARGLVLRLAIAVVMQLIAVVLIGW